MEDHPARHAHEPDGEHGAAFILADAFDALHADDALGEVAACPRSWQHLAIGDPPRD